MGSPEANKRYRQSEKGKAAEKRYQKSAKGRASAIRRAKKYAANNPEKVAEWRATAQTRSRENYPEKTKARSAVSNAIRDGRLKKLDGCENCGASPVEAHHPSYLKSMRLCVTWLCRECHTRLHKESA